MPVVQNLNTDTILLARPLTEFLHDHPAPTKAIDNVYELKTQPELVRYQHATAGYPTQPTWLKAIMNKQFSSWPGLTAEAVRKHYPESEETHTGHGRKTQSGLRSTNRKPRHNPSKEEEFTGPRPTIPLAFKNDVHGGLTLGKPPVSNETGLCMS